MRFVLLLLLLFPWQTAPAQDDDESAAPSSSEDYRGGTLRVGAFAIGGIKAQVYFGPTDIPIRAVIDVREDLGLRDSLVAFRSSFAYRFSKRHAMSIGYYRLKLDGIVQLARTIEIGNSEFDVGIEVLSHFDQQITKFAYNYIFHDEGRVMLSVAPGIHFSNARLSVQALSTIPGGTGLDENENRSVTAPLPMIGGRLVYRLSPKWRIIALSDIFFLDRGSQEGQLTDTHVLVEYKANDHFSFGGGLNRYALDLQLVDDGTIWNMSNVYTGVQLYVGYNF
jgi:hypothetical protein